MAEKKTEVVEKEVKVTPKQDDEYVIYHAFKDDGNYKDDIVVGINGKIYTIQRGIDVKIPKKVYEVLENATAQRNVANTYIEEAERNRSAVIAQL